jgi:hypothetical protein
VEQLRLRGRYSWWNLTDPDGNVVAEFREEADARAFVALPALIEASRTLLKYCSRRDGSIASHEDCVMTFVEDGSTLSECIEKAQAALAQADGPSQEQG